MSKKKNVMSQYQEVVSVDFLKPDQLRTIVALILDHLRLEIVKEETPDYTAFELRQTQ